MHHKILLGPGKIYEFCFFGRKLKDIKIMVSSETWMYARVTFNIGPYQYVQKFKLGFGVEDKLESGQAR